MDSKRKVENTPVKHEPPQKRQKEEEQVTYRTSDDLSVKTSLENDVKQRVTDEHKQNWLSQQFTAIPAQLATVLKKRHISCTYHFEGDVE